VPRDRHYSEIAIVSIPLIHLYHTSDTYPRSIFYSFLLFVLHISHIDRLRALLDTTLHWTSAQSDIQKAIHSSTFGSKHNKAKLDKDTNTLLWTLHSSNPPQRTVHIASLHTVLLYRRRCLTYHLLRHTTQDGGYRADFGVAINVSLGMG
jgi:hypothetical protein